MHTSPKEIVEKKSFFCKSMHQRNCEQQSFDLNKKMKKKLITLNKSICFIKLNILIYYQ